MSHFSEPHTQIELFPAEQNAPVRRSSPRFFLTNLTFSIENVVLIGIVLIMSFVMAFSWGVERGKDKEEAAVTAAPDQPQILAARSQNTLKAKEIVPVMAVPTVPAKTEIKPLAAPSVVADLAKPVSDEPQIAADPAEKNVDKGYTIQVASYAKEEFAQKEAVNLKKEGLEIFVLPKGSYSILCVGKFKDKDKAKSYSRKLKKRYKDCLVRSL